MALEKLGNFRQPSPNKSPSLHTSSPPLPLSEADLAARFTGKGPWKKRLPQIIDTLEALGRVRRQGDALSATD